MANTGGLPEYSDDIAQISIFALLTSNYSGKTDEEINKIFSGIVSRKIIDQYRKAGRRPSHFQIRDDDASDDDRAFEAHDAKFDAPIIVNQLLRDTNDKHGAEMVRYVKHWVNGTKKGRKMLARGKEFSMREWFRIHDLDPLKLPEVRLVIAMWADKYANDHFD